MAYDDLGNLGDKKWLTNNSIDPWLLNLWKTMLQPKFRYLPTYYIPPVGGGETTAEEVKLFRIFFDLSAVGNPCPLEDVVYVLNTGLGPVKTGNHFCTVAFMPSTRVIHILGRGYSTNDSYNDDPDWDSWGGKCIWARLCTLYGWNEEELGEMKLCSVNWTQNGYDCGPIACQIVWDLMTYGYRVNRELKWKMPSFPCCHTLRKTMAQKINEIIVEGVEIFHTLGEGFLRELSADENEYKNWVELMGPMTEAIRHNPGSEMKLVVF